MLPKIGAIKTFSRSITCYLLVIVIAWLWLIPPAQADTETSSLTPYLEAVKEKITKFTLDNGLKFIVLENHQAPVISFVTYADVGGVNEPEGKTGVAHFLEHLAFKGTTQIGTTNYQAEKPLLERLDQIFAQIQGKKAPGFEQNLKQLESEFSKVSAEAKEYVKENEFGQIVETSGGVGLNAATAADYTMYFYNFPANKLELWMSLESERFLEPVFRQFYLEKEVILEERHMRTDNSPIGLMIEAFLDKAFTEHPYKRPVIGYEQDIRNLTRQDVEDFFSTYYSPNNLTIAIVGDVDPANVQQLAQIYFGRYQSKPTPPQVTAVEPPQTQTKQVTLELPSQPWYLEGYHRPGINDRDSAVYDLMFGILSSGRTSRLYKSLVQTQQLAISAQGINTFPGDKYPNLMLFYALTSPNHNVNQVSKALQAEIDLLTTQPVSIEELNRIKTKAKANLLRSLNSNLGMAKLLTEYEVKTGDWQNLFAQLEAITQVTPADIQRVAIATFTPENRTIGRILPLQNK